MHMFLGLKLVFSLFKKLYGATLMNPALVYTYNFFIRIPNYLCTYFWVSNSLFPLFKKMYGATKFVREMTVVLPVNTKSHFTMKYPFTKPRFRLKFPDLAGKICIANFKRKKLSFCDVCFFATKRKTSKPR